MVWGMLFSFSENVGKGEAYEEKLKKKPWREGCREQKLRSAQRLEFNKPFSVRSRYHIPRRSRHYQSMVDVKIMQKGERDYKNLPDGIIIFICTFDLFGYGRYCYTFENRCLEKPELSLGDGTKKIFLNTRGHNAEETDKELIEFLRCIEQTNEMKAENVRVGKILERVHKVKQDAQTEGRYMTTREWMNEIEADAREAGYAAGHEEGWEEGRKEGREEGREEGRGEGREQEAKRYSILTVSLLEQKRYDDLEKAAKDRTFREKIYKQLGIE